VRVAVPSLLLLACARAAPEAQAPQGGLELHGVTVEAWRGAHQTLKGTSPRVRFDQGDVVANDVEASLQGGAHVQTQSLSGDADGTHGELRGGTQLRTADGCVITGGIAHYDRQSVRVEPPFHLDGCGAIVDAKAVRYDLKSHRADFEGPVTTRLEAQK
jgi:hypothetical protein